MIDPSSSEEEWEEEHVQPLPNERGRHPSPAYGPGRNLDIPSSTPRWVKLSILIKVIEKRIFLV